MPTCGIPPAQFTTLVFLAATCRLQIDCHDCPFHWSPAAMVARRPAGRDVLDEATAPVGIPAHVSSEPAAGGNYFFAILKAETSTATVSSAGDLPAGGPPSLACPRSSLDGLHAQVLSG